MKKHVNIPIFIPHLGCPNQCVFCNQRTISGVCDFEISSVRGQIEEALLTIDPSVEAEIAYFGGSFTGIDRQLMISLLQLAYEYVVAGKVTSIRCSTRPDYIDDGILKILKRYGVNTIELGLQSMDDNVLSVTKRGHTRSDAEKACRKIVEHGFNLVGQMMIGLPGSTLEKELDTARFIVEVGAKGARIYPTVVFYGTELYLMSKSEAYSPISLNDAIERSAKVLEVLISASVDVIRVGLCASDNLFDEEKYYAGPNHPAIGEMVESAVIYNRIVGLIANKSSNKEMILTVFVPHGFLSKAIGQRKTNKNRLIQEFGYADVKFKEDSNLSGYELRIEERKRECT